MHTKSKYLIIGSGGQLGCAFQAELSRRGLLFAAPARTECDIADQRQLEQVIKWVKPDIVLNCAAYNDVEQAETDAELAFSVNARAVAGLADLSRCHGAFLVHFSSDYVFDGTKGDYYDEADVPHPLNQYGASKLAGEEAVNRIIAENSLVFRLSWVFGAGTQNFLFKLSSWARRSAVVKVSVDDISVPTYTGDVVPAVLSALQENVTGLYHLTNTGKCSRYEWAKYYLGKKGVAVELTPVPMSVFPSKVRRPLCSPLSNHRLADRLGINLPSWQDAVDRFIAREQESFL